MCLTRLRSCKTCFRSYQLMSKLRLSLTRLSLKVESVNFRLVSIIRPIESMIQKIDPSSVFHKITQA